MVSFVVLSSTLPPLLVPPTPVSIQVPTIYPGPSYWCVLYICPEDLGASVHSTYSPLVYFDMVSEDGNHLATIEPKDIRWKMQELGMVLSWRFSVGFQEVGTANAQKVRIDATVKVASDNTGLVQLRSQDLFECKLVSLLPRDIYVCSVTTSCFCMILPSFGLRIKQLDYCLVVEVENQFKGPLTIHDISLSEFECEKVKLPIQLNCLEVLSIPFVLSTNCNQNKIQFVDMNYTIPKSATVELPLLLYLSAMDYETQLFGTSANASLILPNVLPTISLVSCARFSANVLTEFCFLIDSKRQNICWDLSFQSPVPQVRNNCNFVVKESRIRFVFIRVLL